MAFRTERITSTLKQCIADILLNDVKDPQLKTVIIKDIQMNNDLKKARLIVTTSLESITDIIIKLDKAKGFIKRNLARKMYLKYVPDLIFIADDVDYTKSVDESLLKMDNPNEKEDC